MRVKAKYEVTYSNGFKQIKYVIDRIDYYHSFKYLDFLISDLKSAKNKDNWMTIELKRIQKELYIEPSACIVEDSPLEQSIRTGKLELLPQQGGTHIVKWKKLKL